MNTLENIVLTKKKEVTSKKALYPIQLLESSLYFTSPTVSLSKYLLREDKFGIIAEIKKQSPLSGVINKYVDVEKTAIGYMQAGASALSILTDATFFGGCNQDLIIARKFNYCPILRKDFIIDAYQIIEAKSIGADAILLIAAILTKAEIKSFTELAHSLNMEVILEIHDDIELCKQDESVDIIGVNNRNLTTMKVDIEHSAKMYSQLPTDKVKISESGISTVEDIIYLSNLGYKGFLMGSFFMKQARPHEACKQFIEKIKQSKVFTQN